MRAATLLALMGVFRPIYNLIISNDDYTDCSNYVIMLLPYMYNIHGPNNITVCQKNNSINQPFCLATIALPSSNHNLSDSYLPSNNPVKRKLAISMQISYPRNLRRNERHGQVERFGSFLLHIVSLIVVPHVLPELFRGQTKLTRDFSYQRMKYTHSYILCIIPS